MHHCIFQTSPTYEVAILIKQGALQKDSMLRHYVDPLTTMGLPEGSTIGFSLEYNEHGKCPVKLIVKYLESLLKALDSLGVKTLYVCDSAYFKKMTGKTKAEPHYGYILPCTIEGYEHMNVVLGLNHAALFYNPDMQSKLTLSLKALVSHTNGSHVTIGRDIINYEYYPDKLESIKQVLESLHKYDSLTADFEAFSLKHYESGLGTVSFAWDKNNGIAFCIDYVAYEEPVEIEVWCNKDNKYKTKLAYGYQEMNHEVRALLKEFFITYKRKLIWHNISYDACIAIAQLWMEDITDHHGLYEGLDVMTRNFDCTQIITYLATNSCAGNHLSLKAQAHEYAGNYAEGDIDDIRLIPKENLLRYNLVDCLATWFTYEKNYPIMVKDDQLEPYEGIMKESLVTIIQMQLTGLPMCMEKVKEAKKKLGAVSERHLAAVKASPLLEKAVEILKLKFLDADFDKRKGNAKNPEKIQPKLLENIEWEFNPGSGTQLAVLLHDVIGLPVIETTKTGLPSTDEDTLKALVNHTSDQSVKDLIENILGYGKVGKILSTFIPAFEKAQLGKDGIYYLFGSFKLGGTKSGRLSSSNPNLTNLPSTSEYAKIIKAAFMGSEEWIFCGADFSALEDYVNALLTRDPNKLKIYLDGYDSHSLRAYSYWPEKFPGMVETPEAINRIATTHKMIRSDSKPVTFACAYGGTHHTLMKNCGFSKEEAQRIENNYLKLYQVSVQWTESKLRQAAIDGYVTLAFGLRLRTPVLKQVVWGSASMPHEASAEGRSAGNAVSGQSHGLLNTRAANEFMKRVRNSPYKYDIKLSALIHDAIYLLVRNELGIVKWVNDNLPDCMSWQELPELAHDKVKLNAELDLFPDWSKPVTLPNHATKAEILKLCKGEK